MSIDEICLRKKETQAHETRIEVEWIPSKPPKLVIQLGSNTTTVRIGLATSARGLESALPAVRDSEQESASSSSSLEAFKIRSVGIQATEMNQTSHLNQVVQEKGPGKMADLSAVRKEPAQDTSKGPQPELVTAQVAPPGISALITRLSEGSKIEMSSTHWSCQTNGVIIQWDLKNVVPSYAPCLPLYGPDVREEWTKETGDDNYTVHCSLHDKVQVYYGLSLQRASEVETWIPCGVSVDESRLGTNPIRILAPLLFTLTNPENPVQQHFDTLETGNDNTWLREVRSIGTHPFTWHWLDFWDRQIRYWHQRQADAPEYIQVSWTQGILVNRWVYRALGEVDAHMWVYDEYTPYIGGYVDPELMGLVEWEYPKWRMPRFHAWTDWD
jgi:hypothetical protein